MLVGRNIQKVLDKPLEEVKDAIYYKLQEITLLDIINDLEKIINK